MDLCFYETIPKCTGHSNKICSRPTSVIPLGWTCLLHARVSNLWPMSWIQPMELFYLAHRARGLLWHFTGDQLQQHFYGGRLHLCGSQAAGGSSSSGSRSGTGEKGSGLCLKLSSVKLPLPFPPALLPRVAVPSLVAICVFSILHKTPFRPDNSFLGPNTV